MADIKPFKGIRYNPERVKLEEVITEPYDRIPPPLQEKYYARDPKNYVRVILGKEEDPEHPEKDRYRRARLYLEEWLENGTLIEEDQEALYLYEQEFDVSGQRLNRTGLVARVKLEEFSSRKVLPHEKTFPKHKADRLNLLRTTNTNTGQIFLLYKDDDLRVKEAVAQARQGAELGAEVVDEDHFTHRLWIIKDKTAIAEIQEAMSEKVLIIADGHHRYETSLNYQKEKRAESDTIQGDEPFNYIMMTLFRLDDPGLVILPTYRLVKGLDKLSPENLKEILSPYFDIQELEAAVPTEQEALAKVQAAVNSEPHTFAAYAAQFQKYYLFCLKSEEILDREISEERSKEWKRLDVAILHSLIIDKLAPLSSVPFALEDNVSYIRDLNQGLTKVMDGEFQMIFLLRPAELNQIRQVVENGELMPQKSTDFFPKLKSGLVINPLRD